MVLDGVDLNFQQPNYLLKHRKRRHQRIDHREGQM